MIQNIEELSMNAFPSLSTVLANGWILRFSNGYQRRSNSVNPINPCRIAVEDNIKLCDEMFKSKHLDTIFKLTEMKEAYVIDEILDKQGYAYEAKTNIMLKTISEFHITEEEKEGVVIFNELRKNWLEAFVRMNNVSDVHAVTLERMLQSIIPEAYYAYIMNDGKIAAVGLGVAERGFVGIYDIYVDPEKRRQGLATRIMKNLLNEASNKGHSYSYLQVVDANKEAKKLYEKLGYEKQYSYWYRIKKFKIELGDK